MTIDDNILTQSKAISATNSGDYCYRVRANASGWWEWSDVEVITVALPDPFITVTSPNGSENWQVGSSHEITWTSSGASGNVRIEYSVNNGSSWTGVIASTPDDVTQPWTIPNTPSTTCLIRVADVDGFPSDVSNGVFTIVAAGDQGDVNDDAAINSSDALIILSYDVGMSVPFPVSQSGCNSAVTPCEGCGP